MNIRSVLLPAVLGTLTLAAATDVLAQSAGAPEKKEVAIGATSDPQIGGPWVVARQKAFFSSEGLTQGDVKLYASGPQAFAEFATGALQGNTSGEQAMVIQAAAGVPLKLVGVYSDCTGVHGMVATGAIKSAKDLEGKSIGLQKGSSAEWYTRNFCKIFGCDLTKVRILNMPPPEAVAAFVNGNIDAHAGWQPFLNRAMEAGKGKGAHFLHYDNTALMVGAQGPRKIETCWGSFYVAKKFLDENPRTVEAMLRVLDKSVAFINSNKSEAVKIMAREFKVPVQEMEKLVSAIQYELQIDDERVRDIQATVDLLLAEKIIRTRVDVPTQVLDSAPLRRVRASAVKYGR